MENTTETTPAEVSKEQLDTFFESGGEVAPEVSEPESISVEKEILEDKPTPAKEEKYVPLAALHEERTRRKEMQSEIDRMKAIINEAYQARQPKPEPPPSFDDDPAMNLKYQTEALRSETEAMKQHLQRQAEQSQQQAYSNQLIDHYRSSAVEFAKTNPEFTEAYNYLLKQRSDEYLAAGYQQEELGQYLIGDEFSIVDKAVKDGVNPAERILALAKARGFSGKQSDQKIQSKIEKIEKGIQAGKSLSSARGVSDSDVTLESLADLPTDEFNKMWKKLIADKS